MNRSNLCYNLDMKYTALVETGYWFNSTFMFINPNWKLLTTEIILFYQLPYLDILFFNFLYPLYRSQHFTQKYFRHGISLYEIFVFIIFNINTPFALNLGFIDYKQSA